MIQNKQGKGLIRLGWLTVLVVYIVNLSGFVDTLTGSVTGCGKSWPLCNGSIAPWTWDIHAWIEFTHRALVFSMTVMVIALARVTNITASLGTICFNKGVYVTDQSALEGD
ncbi:hypothetical protein A8990_11065 [Paenibacillus taihuensis]|uniref:Cytochrome c oxidase assembly protein subunit 15 n=1 Tax=Paenibacillus taihuensis TaxID=1156355 RepID=A0A3D9S1J4_9BACL|nr:hypothetical protein [Paenibacillus taihuensis]REE86456.1 hypothetical protein A8990_11065 [Paenibacillus taihuensis]